MTSSCGSDDAVEYSVNMTCLLDEWINTLDDRLVDKENCTVFIRNERSVSIDTSQSEWLIELPDPPMYFESGKYF